MEIKVAPVLSCRSSPWEFYSVVLDILMVAKSFELIQWFALTAVSMMLTTYLNVSFFSTITVDITQGLKYLILLIVFENATAYCALRQNLAKRTFVLDFLKHFRTKMNQRILSADWMKIKLSDQVEIRRKLEEASSSVQYLVEQFIDQLKEVSKFVTAVTTILYLCPIATVLIGVVYVCFYHFYLNKQSAGLLEAKLKMVEEDDRLSSKYARANANMFEYVLHHEKNKIINITNELKIDMERQWFLLDYLYDYLSFKENILGKLCTFLTITIYYRLSGANVFILPLYHYLSSLTDTIHELLCAYIQWVRLKKDYDLAKPILDEYDERVNAEQIELTGELQIRDLSFHYEGARETFCLQFAGELTFKMGEAILVTGKSGAGNFVSPCHASHTRILF